MTVTGATRCTAAAAGHGHSLCQAEIEHLHRAVVPDLDVGGFQIAVDDALFVGGVERVDDLPGDRHGVGHRQWTARDDRGEILAVDELHDERLRAAVFFEAVDGRDVRMVQRRKGLGFAQ